VKYDDFLELVKQRRSIRIGPVFGGQVRLSQRRWTLAEESRARSLYEAGIPVAAMVAELGRSRNSILTKAVGGSWHRPEFAKQPKARVTWEADDSKVLQASSSRAFN